MVSSRSWRRRAGGPTCWICRRRQRRRGAQLQLYAGLAGFDDTGTPAYTTTIAYGFTTAIYRSAVLPAPIYLETFDTTEEGELPAGWTQTNATTSVNPGLNLDDSKSDSYLGWTVLGPYIGGRINDDQAESKRFEVFRLDLLIPIPQRLAEPSDDTALDRDIHTDKRYRSSAHYRASAPWCDSVRVDRRWDCSSE